MQKNTHGFSLVELLVVIAILSLLLAILVPSLGKARDHARLAVCGAHLRDVGVAIHLYANDHEDTIPFGPEGRPVTGSNFYTVTGNVTSLLSLEGGDVVGLGLLLEEYLFDKPQVLFCPGTDQPSQAKEQLPLVGRDQAQCDYFYRHASVAMLSGTPDEFRIRLSRLGKNRDGAAIAALVMDVQFLAHKSLIPFQVITRTSHRGKFSNVLFVDGRVSAVPNRDDRLTVDIGAHPYDALEKILTAFETADLEW